MTVEEENPVEVENTEGTKKSKYSTDSSNRPEYLRDFEDVDALDD